MRILIVVSLLVAVTGTIACSDNESVIAPPEPAPEPVIPEPEAEPEPIPEAEPAVKEPEPVPTYTFSIVNTFPHDSDAFTQGLAFADGILYEGTGLRGKSSLRKVELETGGILQSYQLHDVYFGEGITVFNDTVIQLTWRASTGFVYDRNSFEILRNFIYRTEGWGITHDGERLIMSDGTSKLYFLDAGTFEVIGNIEVHDGDRPIGYLNELEYIDGRIYANVWPTDSIAMIDPVSGNVTGWLDLSGILSPPDEPVDVLNGIAYDADNKRLFVTGKWWPWLYEIELVPKE